MYTRAPSYIHTHVRTYENTYVYIYLHLCIYVFTYAYVFVYIYMLRYAHYISALPIYIECLFSCIVGERCALQVWSFTVLTHVLFGSSKTFASTIVS